MLGQKLEKTIVIFEISTLEFLKNECLTNTGSAFYKAPGSVSSEILDPGPGPLYKVCAMLCVYTSIKDFCIFWCLPEKFVNWNNVSSWKTAMQWLLESKFKFKFTFCF